MDSEIPGKIDQVTNEDEVRAPFKQVTPPDDFEDAESFLRYAIKLFDTALDFDRENREQAINDAKFMVGDQWEEFIKQRRVGAKKPTLVLNRLPAFVGQIIGNWRLNQTMIKVLPDDAGFKEVAQIREGLIRSIQKVSKADMAYTKALENQVISGMGNFEVGLEYASDDVFEQDIKVKTINNPFSVVWDTQMQDITGADAKYVFSTTPMLREDFNAQWPHARAADATNDTRLLGVDIDTQWITKDEVRVTHMWRMRSEKRIVALVASPGTETEDPGQDVEDVTEQNPEDYMDRVVVDSNGVPVMREVDRKFAQLYIMTALDLLEGPYDLPIKRVPVFAVPGWDVNVGAERTRFGIVRFMKDPQRLHNYWRSTIAEKLMMAPKAVWIAPQEAVEGHEKQFRESHLSDDTLLTYDGEAGVEPRRVEPAEIEPALIQEAGMAVQDMRDISNIHEASLGQQSNEVSGKAILARQRVGEVGTVIYQDNLTNAIEEAGRVINDLIPFAYDTVRTIKVLGEEGEDLDPVVINDTTNNNSVDITTGKYTVSSVTGPSTVTKRVEAGESMLNMVNAMPQTMLVAADKIVEAQDWPGATEISRRIKTQLPPGVLSAEDMTPEQLQAAQASAAQAAELQQKQDVVLAADLELKLAQAEQAKGLAAQSNANATKAEAEAALAISRVGVDQFEAVTDRESARAKSVLEAGKFFEEATTPK